MYYVITYRSRKLKKNTIIAEEPSSAISASVDKIDEDEKLTFKQKRELKKELKRARKEKFIEISGSDEYDERDFDPEEIEDMKAASLLNKDSFYDALDPIDLGEPKDRRTLERSDIIKFTVAGVVMLVVLVAFVLIARMFI